MSQSDFSRLLPVEQVPMELAPEDLNFFCEHISRLAGIAMRRAKHDLVKTRLHSRIVELKLGGYAEYRKMLEALPAGHAEWQSFINLLTTNKTDFFREPGHFDYLVEKILPAWIKTNPRGTFRVWSAASSTGEEAYTMAMVLARHLDPAQDFRIVASDIDTEVLAKASNAVYPESKLVEIPSDYRSSSVRMGRDGARGWFRIAPALKEKVIFRRYNLVTDPLWSGESFDLILCRNVMIYFTPETVGNLSEKLFGAARKGGYLFIGHSETLQGNKRGWVTQEAAIYRKA